METQRTLKKNLSYSGKEFYGGKEVEVFIEPANENTGIVFQTRKGDVKATIENAKQSRSTIMLQEKRARVLHVEHLLAALYAYEIDNALISLTEKPTISFNTSSICCLRKLLT